MTISMPNYPAFKVSNFFLEANTQTFESPLNRATQRLELAGQRWRASYTLPRMTRSQAAAWIAFFLQCKGRAEKFTAYDPDWKVNLGAWSGTPLVMGAGQTGNSLIIDGATASVTNWAKAGDYFTVNSELKRLVANANSNGSGQVTLTFEPYLRTAPADNAVISCNPATCTMIMTDDIISQWQSNHNKIYEEKTFDAYEVF
jgi:hypothetical protein